MSQQSDTSDRAADRPHAPLRSWLGVGVLTLTFFMAMLDMTIVFLALPTVAADLEPGATQQLWVLHVGEIIGAGLVLTIGRLADRFGARRVLAVGIVAYGASSLVAAFSTSVEMLIVARALLGASAVSFAPAGMILIRRLFVDGRQFAMAMGIYMASASAGMALGPPIGGLLLEVFPWGSIFLVNVAIAVIALAGLRILPYVAARPGGRIDVPSVLLSIGAVALFVNGVQELAADGVRWTEAASATAGLALGYVFVRRQRRTDDPLLDPGLFRSRAFTLAALGIGLVIVAQVGAEMQMAQHLQAAMGLSPRDAGLVLIVPAGLAVLGTIVAPMLLHWLTPAQVIGGGVLLSALGAIGVAVTAAGSGTGSVAAVVAGMSVVEIGAAPMFGLGAGLVVASAPDGHVGSASAVQDVSGGLGNTFGLTIGGTISFVVYQSLLTARLPEDLSVDDRDTARESVGAATATAKQLPGATGDALADAAREAFAAATVSLYAVAAVLFVAIAVISLRGLRDARIDPDD